MKKKELVRLIREVVKREVKNQVNVLLTEQKQQKEITSIKEALDQTKALEDYPTMRTFNAADARAGFAAMQNGFQQTQQQDINGRPVDGNALPDTIQNALTRDYSELVKKMKR